MLWRRSDQPSTVVGGPQSSGSGVAARSSQPTNRGLAAARNGIPASRPISPSRQSNATSRRDGPNVKSPTKKVHGRPPSVPMLGSTKSLKAAVDSIGAVESRSPSSSARVRSMSSRVRSEPVSRRRSGGAPAPERFERLELGVMEDVAEKSSHCGLDAGDQLGLKRFLTTSVRCRDLIEEHSPGTGLNGGGRRRSC